MLDPTFLITVRDIVDTPTVIAGFFTVVGIMLNRLWDTRNKRAENRETRRNVAQEKLDAEIREQNRLFLEDASKYRSELQDELHSLRAQMDQLRNESLQLRSENVLIREENLELKKRNIQYEQERMDMSKRIFDLESEVKRLTALVETA